MSNPNKIILRGEPNVHREDACNAAVIPGMLLEFNSNDKIQKHSTSGGRSARMFALEVDYVGNEIETASAAGDRIPYGDFAPGAILYALLASGQNVARGEYLMSNGAGMLTSVTSTNIAVAQADEDCNASATFTDAAATYRRIRARVI